MTPQNALLDDRERKRFFTAIFTCVAIYGFTIGLITPLLSLILESRGTERSLIGLVAAMPAFGMLLLSANIPRLIAALGIRQFLLICLVGNLVLIPLFPLFDNIYAWMLIRLVMGACINGLFVASETWINELAIEQTRGRVIGAYSAILTATIASGPLLIPLTGTEGWLPFAVGTALVALAVFPLAGTGTSTPLVHGKSSFRILSFIRIAPTITAAVLLFSILEFSNAALMPVYGVRNQMDQSSAAIMLTVTGLGGVVLQYPIGWLADKCDRQALLLTCGVFTGLGACLLPFVMGSTIVLWGLLFIWGGIFAGMYTVTLTLVGERFRGVDLATANAAIGLLWGVGSLLGPSLTGVAMDLWDPHGFPMTIVLASLCFVVLALARRSIN